jgi:hypothetical protein
LQINFIKKKYKTIQFIGRDHPWSYTNKLCRAHFWCVFRTEQEDRTLNFVPQNGTGCS